MIGVRMLAGQPFDREPSAPMPASSSSANGSGASISAPVPTRSDRSLSINGVRQQVVAVAPDAFEDPLVPGVEVWTPLDFQSQNRTQWYNHYLSVIGRLRPGATLEQAQAELKTIALQIEPNYGRVRFVAGRASRRCRSTRSGRPEACCGSSSARSRCC